MKPNTYGRAAVKPREKKSRSVGQTIFRSDGEDRSYTRISNVLLQHKDISDDTGFMLCRLLSRPKDWTISIEGLIATSKSGKHRVNRQVAEAMKLGFMRKDVLRKVDGTVKQIVYTVSDNPAKLAEINPLPDFQEVADHPLSDYQEPDKQEVDNPPQQRKEVTKDRNYKKESMRSTSSCDDAADQEGFSKEGPAPVRNRNPRTGVIWETKGRAGDTSLYCDREAEDRWLETNFDTASYLAQDMDLGISDAVLRAKLRKAADGRIAKALLTDDGLETAKTIIAKVLETEGYDELPDETPARPTSSGRLAFSSASSSGAGASARMTGSITGVPFRCALPAMAMTAAAAMMCTSTMARCRSEKRAIVMGDTMDDGVFESMRQFAAGLRGNSRPTIAQVVAVGRETAERLGLRVPSIVLELRAEQVLRLCAGADRHRVRAARSRQTVRAKVRAWA